MEVLSSFPLSLVVELMSKKIEATSYLIIPSQKTDTHKPTPPPQTVGGRIPKVDPP